MVDTFQIHIVCAFLLLQEQSSRPLPLRRKQKMMILGKENEWKICIKKETVFSVINTTEIVFT
jgi:hypothetical protein